MRVLMHPCSSAHAGHGEVVEHLIQRGADAVVNSADDEARIALPQRRTQRARGTRNGALGLRSAALTQRTLTRLAASQGWTPLMSAASTGSARVVNLLLGVGAEADAANSGGRTALYYAVSKGHTAIAALLLDAGARVNRRDCVGASPLHRAAAAGQQAAVRALLAAGAAIDAADAQGATPVLVAAQAGQESVCVTLAAAGADLSARDREGNTLASLVPRLTSVLTAAAAGEVMEWDE
jgi:ankyrin repeat protein